MLGSFRPRPVREGGTGCVERGNGDEEGVRCFADTGDRRRIAAACRGADRCGAEVVSAVLADDTAVVALGEPGVWRGIAYLAGVSMQCGHSIPAMRTNKREEAMSEIVSIEGGGANTIILVGYWQGRISHSTILARRLR